jgi:hypothetical protein
MAKKSKRRAWTTADVRMLKTAARKKTRASSIARTLKRTEGATPPEGIQPRPVPRLASLIQFNQFNGQEAPFTSGGFHFTPRNPQPTPFAPTCWSGGHELGREASIFIPFRPPP